MATKARMLSIVVPCYNEGRTVAEVVARARAADIGGLEREIIVVDDGSRDGTGGVLRGIAGVRVITHGENRGKGAAVKSGFAAARGEIVLIQDGDLEYDPEDYKAVIAPIVAGRAEAVMGTRFAGAPRARARRGRLMSWAQALANAAIVGLTNLLYAAAATDYEGAYKAFRKDAIAGIDVEADGFAFDNELICKLLRRGARVVETPIRYRPRTYAEGKKIGWADGVEILWTIVQWRFRRIEAR